MARLATLLCTAVLLASAAPAASAADVVVTPAWLAEHLKDPDLVILQVGDKESYDRGHVPGARYLDFRQLSDPAAKLRLQMPPAERLRDLFEGFGVSDASRIVIYFAGGSPTAAARTFVSLDYLGLGDRASILDGGQAAWTAAGQALSTETATPARGHITVAPHPDVVVDGAYVQAHLKDPGVQIIDARNHEYYTGEKSASMPRDGHIAGAANVPFDTLVDPKTTALKDEATLRQMLQSAGASADKQLIAYCHIGQQASEVYLVARLLGYRVHLYDGSFEDWSAHPEWPIRTGEAK